MSEKLQAFFRFLEARIRIVAWVVGVLLLGAVMYLKSSEAPTPPPSGGGGSTPWPPQDDAAEAKRIQGAVMAEVKPVEQSDYGYLISNSMFNVKSVRNAVEQEAQANERYEEAQRLFRERNYQSAMTAVDDVLRLRPTHLPARQLKESLEKILNAPEDGGAQP